MNTPIAAWGSDLHLNFLDHGKASEFIKTVDAAGLPFLVSGDISDGRKLAMHLGLLGDNCSSTCYFVSGNHDYYHSSFAGVNRIMRRAVLDHPNLVYLPHAGLTELVPGVGLIGPDGWCDGRIVDNLHLTPFGMNDFLLISDLNMAWPDEDRRNVIIDRMRAKADAGVVALTAMLQAAVGKYDRVVILSHTAPFAEMDTRRSELSPFYVWKSAGDTIKDFASGHPGMKFLWLSGHTHCHSKLEVLPNLTCASNHASYRNPHMDGRVYDDLTVHAVEGIRWQ
jgi:predicted phosphohydrolase